MTETDFEAALREGRRIGRCAECHGELNYRERPKSLFCSRKCGYRFRDRRRYAENPEAQRTRTRRYYANHREQVLDRAAVKRGRPRPPERTTCSECGGPLEGRRRVVCSARCGEVRYRRLHPEAYTEKEARKVERRRRRRRSARC